jgi:hypothetical protein
MIEVKTRVIRRCARTCFSRSKKTKQKQHQALYALDGYVEKFFFQIQTKQIAQPLRPLVNAIVDGYIDASLRIDELLRLMTKLVQSFSDGTYLKDGDIPETLCDFR